MCQVLIVASGTFVEACGIFHWDMRALRCGVRASLYLWHVCFLFFNYGVRAPEHVGSVVCGMWVLYLRHMSSVVVAHGLSCPATCGILVPRPGIEPASPAWEDRFFTTGPPGKSPLNHIFLKGVSCRQYIVGSF